MTDGATRGRAATVGSVAAAIGAPVDGDPDIVVASATHDSRAVTPGALFCCVPGQVADGHDFAGAAVDAGAVALLVERALPLDVTQVIVDDVRARMGTAAAEVYGRPSDDVAVVGVTGTNGKTTVVWIIAHILEASGRSTEVIGTLTGARTTPESTDLQARLRTAADAGRTAVAMEVSSHTLALHRVDGIGFAVVVFTNLGSDHLDFHGTPERYFEAKARLFEAGRAHLAVLGVDDVHGRLLRDTTPLPLVAVSLADAGDIVLDGTGASFTWRDRPVRLPLLGRHNVANALLAAEACAALGIDPADVVTALGSVPTPPGRFEVVSAGQPFAVIVDFAHTPDALERALEAARVVASGAVHVVFGSGGDRDSTKRPRMGAVADELADRITITSDNPRSEDPSAIMAAVRTGVERLEPRLVEDRREAIRGALAGASAGDVVLIAGKGHEDTQTIGARIEPFDDRAVAREVLAELGWGDAS